MRITVVTVTNDWPPFADEAIASVKRDEAFELEHIVVADGAPEFADALSKQHPEIKVVQGRRAGATAAAAQGIEAASGDFIILLHSDDRLCAGALAQLAFCASERPQVKIWTGGVRIFRNLPGGGEATVRQVASPELTRLSLRNVCDHIPLLTARFCHRSVFAEIGSFDPGFSESSDREFLLRAAIAGVAEAPLGVMVSEMRVHEGSRTLNGRRDGVPPYFAEHVRIAEMWLARSCLDGRTRRFLQNWRAREQLRLVVHRCRMRQLGQAAGLIVRALLLDPLWMFRVTTVLAAQRHRRNDIGT
jgi:glycosyltransferase involved in cell wall biosynthesis